MQLLSKKLAHARGENVDSLFYWCPACEALHGVNIEPARSPKWTWDGDAESPTISPSILCFTTYDEDADSDKPVELPNGQRRTLCHHFVKAGKVEFCSDNPHALNGQTVELPDLPEWFQRYGDNGEARTET